MTERANERGRGRECIEWALSGNTVVVASLRKSELSTAVNGKKKKGREGKKSLGGWGMRVD